MKAILRTSLNKPSWRIAVAVIIGVACIAAAVVFACMMISADR